MQHARSTRIGSVVVAAVLATAVAPSVPGQHRTENVVLVTYDGLRWQEVFGGADVALFDEEGGGVPRGDALFALRRDFLADDPVERRNRLMPFFWSVLATEGQVFGDADHGSLARCSNEHRFSYPGYHELLCGFADERIDSNAKRPNPNRTVLEFLHDPSAERGRVAAFTSWDVFPSIINDKRSGIMVNAGWAEPDLLGADPEFAAMYRDFHATLPHYWAGVRFDALTFAAALDHLRREQPRVLYLSFGESDDWGHARRYDLYLHAAHAADRMLRQLWEALQGIPAYADRTTLILTTDHGRGSTAEDWTNHGAEVPGADRIWIAMIGPDTPALGPRAEVEVTQAQVAATVAAAVGRDWPAAESRAAATLPGAFR